MSNTPNAPLKAPGTAPRQGRNPPRSLDPQLSQLAFENAIQEGLIQPYQEDTSGLHNPASGYETPDEGNALPEVRTPVFQAQNQGFHTPPPLSLDEPPRQEEEYEEARRRRRFNRNMG